MHKVIIKKTNKQTKTITKTKQNKTKQNKQTNPQKYDLFIPWNENTYVISLEYSFYVVVLALYWLFYNYLILFMCFYSFCLPCVNNTNVPGQYSARILNLFLLKFIFGLIVPYLV